MAKSVPPKKSSPLVPVTVNLPQELIDKAKALADDQGLTYGDLYRDCFMDGLASQFEKFTKAEVYAKVRSRNQQAEGDLTTTSPGAIAASSSSTSRS